jgi:hypothetical protein
LAPNYSSGYLFNAWLLATCPDAKYHDGKREVALAKKAIPKDQFVSGSRLFQGAKVEKRIY